MPAAYQNLLIEQGTTYSTTITLDDAYGNNYNLVGYSANSQIRKSYYSSNATATFSTGINTGTSSITLNLSSTITSSISPGRYVYDTIITDTSNNVTRILEGMIDVSPRVSR
tara:strand:+ start:150 stop:485 length:336 start_codon:yes stop_codon:yes gene_type:complete